MREFWRTNKLVGVFFGIVPMFVPKDFVRRRADICANFGEFQRTRTYLGDGAMPNKILWYEHWDYPKE